MATAHNRYEQDLSRGERTVTECEGCGAPISGISGQIVKCPYCGMERKINLSEQYSDTTQYFSSEEAGYNFERGRIRAQEEHSKSSQVTNSDAIYSQNGSSPTQPQKPHKRRTWLWVLGWIYMFPIPLTILVLRNKKLKPSVRYIIVALIWIVIFAIYIFGKKSEDEIIAAGILL